MLWAPLPKVGHVRGATMACIDGQDSYQHICVIFYAGCMKALLPQLKDIVPYLIASLSDENPLVRAICCWTLSRYCKWSMTEEGKHTYPRLVSEVQSSANHLILLSENTPPVCWCVLVATRSRFVNSAVPHSSPPSSCNVLPTATKRPKKLPAVRWRHWPRNHPRS